MKKWLAITLGLIVLAILCFVCVQHHSRTMQQDIAGRSSAALAETGLSWATATVNGRDVTLTGTAPSAAAQMQALRIIEGVGGVRTVANQVTISNATPALSSPSSAAARPATTATAYRTQIDYNGNAVTLTGHAPSIGDANRLALLVRERLTRSVANRLTVNTPGPANWETAAAAVVTRLKPFSQAQASISAGTVALAGTLAEGGNAAAVQAAVHAALPANYSAALALQAAAAPAACSPVKACPTPPVAECPPPPACPSCPAVADCPAIVEPNRGTADAAAMAEVLPIADTFSAEVISDEIPSSAKANNLASRQACQKQFNTLLAGASDVLFRISKAEVTARGRRLLSRVANAANECPSANLQVAGHTDSRGPRAMNQALSERRAEAVKQALIELGVSEFRLSAIGYGESSPVASNNSIAGRQANRRVEIIVEGL